MPNKIAIKKQNNWKKVPLINRSKISKIIVNNNNNKIKLRQFKNLKILRKSQLFKINNHNKKQVQQFKVHSHKKKFS